MILLLHRRGAVDVKDERGRSSLCILKNAVQQYLKLMLDLIGSLGTNCYEVNNKIRRGFFWAS